MPRDYSYIIIDDEPHAIRLLSKTIARYYDHLHMAGAYTTWDTALKALVKNDADLIFMDISIPHTNGMMLLEMAPAQKGEIVFVTAHEEHALKAYEYAPSGYILKPIADDKLIATIDKAIQRIDGNKKTEEHAQVHQQKIAIPERSGYKYYDIAKIIFLEANGSYTKIYFPDKQTVTTSKGLGNFELPLKANGFLRVHKSYLVNTAHIEALRKEDGGYLLMSNGSEIPLSSKNREEIISQLKHFAPHI